MQEDKQQIHYFLFINRKSGGNYGQKYLELQKNQYAYKIKESKIIHIYLVDLYNPSGKNQALLSISQILPKNQAVHAIICGGDGTVLWVINQIDQYGLDLNDIIFGIIPIGTGNDFAQTFGWGTKPITITNSNHSSLEKLIIDWINAEVQTIDVWEVQIISDGIYTIKNGIQCKLQSNDFCRSFTNYFGVGIGARIAYTVEKHRKPNKYLNLCMYCFVGMIYICKKTNDLKNMVKGFTDNSLYDRRQEKDQTNISIDRPLSYRKPLMNQTDIENSPTTQIKLKPGYTSLQCINTLSFMGGRRNLWRTSEHGSNINNGYTPQMIDDGRIQFIGFKNELRMGLQVAFNMGAKIAQGHGPFQINFDESKEAYPIYIHVDGEAYRVNNIKTIHIHRNPKYKSIRVLYKKS